MEKLLWSKGLFEGLFFEIICELFANLYLKLLTIKKAKCIIICELFANWSRFMEYKTKQREILLDFFCKNEDVSFSAEQIYENLKSTGISQSAVYRNIRALEESGKVRKIAKAGSREAFYQYVDLDDCKGHLHMSCKKCGKTTHLEEKEAEILSKIFSESNFEIDNDSTVIYGTCKDCENKK